MTAFEQVSQIIECQVGETEITLGTKLRDLITDSLEMASLLLEFEEALGITINDDDMDKIHTVQDVVDLVPR